MVSVWRALVLAGVAIGAACGGGMLIARPLAPPGLPNDGPLCLDSALVKNGGQKVPEDIFRITLPWQEEEGIWKGRWTPVGDRIGHFTSVWSSGRVGDTNQRADLQITINGQYVQVHRTEAKGTCDYTGHKVGDGWRVTGSYTCTWSPRPMAWSAAIGPGHALPVPPPCDQRDPRLNVAWRETEGAWRGNWQPSGGTGIYNARWTQPTESASATLQIEIRPDNNVVVLRSQAEGNCHYSGRLGPTGWTVSGTYYCDWQPVPRVMQPWSAVMGTGRAPGS